MLSPWRYFKSQIPLMLFGLLAIAFVIWQTHDIEGRIGTVTMAAGVTAGTVITIIPLMLAISIYLDDREYRKKKS